MYDYSDMGGLLTNVCLEVREFWVVTKNHNQPNNDHV